MSAISNIFNTVETIITTALPNHTEMINPYFPEHDSNINLDAAYGIILGEGLNARGDIFPGGAEQHQRTLEVLLTRRMFAKKSDTATRKTAEKQILEDFTTLNAYMAQDRSLTGFAQKVYYTNDTGIQFARVNRNDILVVRINYQIDYEQEVILCP